MSTTQIPMITDARVFDTEGHLPAAIIGRNSQMNEITDSLAPIEDGFQAENCFLFGPSGAGKTTVARAAVRELRREVLDVPHGLVNCWRNYTRAAVLERAVSELTSATVKRSDPTNDHVATLQTHLDQPAVLILDEVDQLKEKNVLYDLHSVSGLSWVAIANREVDLLANLDERVKSRISSGYPIRFNRYSDHTLLQIVRRRADQGLTPSAVTDDVLEEIVRGADGDARMAIDSLRVAARKAESEGLSNVPARIVEDAVIQAREEVRQKRISDLNTHQRVVYLVVKNHGPLIQSEMYEHYQQEHSDPITLRALRKSHLPKLEHYNLIGAERTGRGTEYRIVD